MCSLKHCLEEFFFLNTAELFFWNGCMIGFCLGRSAETLLVVKFRFLIKILSWKLQFEGKRRIYFSDNQTLKKTPKKFYFGVQYFSQAFEGKAMSCFPVVFNSAFFMVKRHHFNRFYNQKWVVELSSLRKTRSIAKV